MIDNPQYSGATNTRNAEYYLERALLLLRGRFATDAEEQLIGQLRCYIRPREAHSCDIEGCAVCDPTYGL